MATMNLYRVEMTLDIVVAAESEAEAYKNAPEYVDEAKHEISIESVTPIKTAADLPQGYDIHANAYAERDVEIATILGLEAVAMSTDLRKPLVGPRADRSTEPQAEACATHEIAVILIVRADVQEDTTEAHLIEYISAHLENREPSPDLHEDIYDELESATMRVRGRGVGKGSMLACAARLVQQDCANAVKGMRVAS